MKHLVSSEQMKEIDSYTIKTIGVPSLVLMERASLSVVEELEKDFDLRKVLVVCGSGNNGGDGIAIARLLHLKGYPTEIYMAGKEESFTEETRTQWEISRNYGVTAVNKFEICEYTTIVDSIFGVGLSREITGSYKELIDKINDSGKPVLAVDIPSGVHGTTGKIMGTAVKAKKTVTFAYGKTGLFLLPGAQFAGEVIIKDIGIYNTGKNSLCLLEEDILKQLSERSPFGNKGTFGKILVVAGSPGMSGAAYFASRAALLAGAGMVKVFTEKRNRTAIHQLLPEALMTTYHSYDTKKSILKKLSEDLSWADVIAAGPGLGQSEISQLLMETLMKEKTEKPLLVDADGINIISQKKELLKKAERPVILTPHVGEMSRLCGSSIEQIKEYPVKCVSDFQREYKGVLVLKDADTLIGTTDGQIALYKGENSGMATAGSGDVLAGIIAGLSGGGLDIDQAALTGVVLHGKAGEYAKDEKGERSMTASDILEGIWKALRYEVKSEE